MRGKKESEEWTAAAKDAFLKQNRIALFDAQLGLHNANTAQADAQRRLDEATKTPDEKAKGAAVEKIGKELEAAAKRQPKPPPQSPRQPSWPRLIQRLLSSRARGKIIQPSAQDGGSPLHAGSRIPTIR
jgi:hypothetical protein